MLNLRGTFGRILGIIRFLIDSLTDIIYPLIFNKPKLRGPLSPAIKSDILLQPAVELARKIRNGKLHSVEVVEAFIQRTNDVNGEINCFIDTCFDQALAEAKKVDEVVSKSSKDDLQRLEREKPFYGVPFSTKDCFEVDGLSWTAGLFYRKNVKGKNDADAIRLMKEAGAIMIGVTNVSELCMWMESSNNIYGRTANPYHRGRIVGGSSGGEACAQAAAASPIGIGSDVGGSIRMPAFFCGIFGHKPSTGIISNQGQIPPAYGDVDKFLTTGPLCRYAEDLIPCLKVLVKPEKRDLLRLDEPVDISKLKVYYMTDDGGFPLITPVDSELLEAQAKVVGALKQNFGIEAKKVNIRNMFWSFDIWSNKMLQTPEGSPSFSMEMTGEPEKGVEISAFWELLKWFCFKSTNHTLPGLFLSIVEKTVTKGSAKQLHFIKKCEDLVKELDELLGTDGVLLYPSHSTPAAYHGQPLTRPFNFAYTGIFNVTGFPVTQTPLGLTDEGSKWGGVPTGIQIVAGRNQDRNSLALATELEKVFGGWKCPSKIDC